MLRIRLEIVPFGDETKIREIGRLDVSNIGYASDTSDLCNYSVIQIDNDTVGQYTDTIQHYRRQGPWVLLERVLHQLVNLPKNEDKS